MQLHLETDELNLVADILMQRIGKASAQAARFSSRPDESIRLGPQFYDRLLDKILARDMRLDTDELDQIGELLDTQRCTVDRADRPRGECCPASRVATPVEAAGPHPGEN